MSYVDARHLSVAEVLDSAPLWRGVGLCVLVAPDVATELGDTIDVPLIVDPADDFEVPLPPPKVPDVV